MAQTFEVIEDEIYGLLVAEWNAKTPAIIGGADPASLVFESTEWTGRVKTPDPGAAVGWARVSLRHSESSQATLTDDNNKKRYRTGGQVIVQCFAAMSDSAGGVIASRLARVVWVAFQGKRTNNVVFGAIRPVEIGREGTWYQFNVTVDFSWDEVR